MRRWLKKQIIEFSILPYLENKTPIASYKGNEDRGKYLEYDR